MTPNWLAAALVAVALWPAVAAAQSSGPADEGAREGEFGLGLIIGAPTGLSLKGFVSPDVAIDGAVGFGLIGKDHLHVHADVLWHFRIQTWSAAALDLYLGVGPKLGFHDHRRDHGDTRLGVRAPFGLAVPFTRAPFDVFLEVAAGLWLIDKVGFHLDAAIGGRFWF